MGGLDVDDAHRRRRRGRGRLADPDRLVLTGEATVGYGRVDPDAISG
jgi:hypothetical protein